MPAHPFKLGAWVSIALAALAHAHVCAYHPAMYCINGTDPKANPNNNNAPVIPLYELPLNQFWMHHSNGCDQYPPDEGVFLELYAGGNFTVELSTNRAFTTLNTDPNRKITDWPGGVDEPVIPTDGTCITTPNIHTQNETMAAGTAWAIAYESDISKVNITNLVVFSVRYNTPWKRVVSHDVPDGMPPCPDGGCICTWHWIPDGCGQPNIYMFPYRCRVHPRNGTTPRTIGTPRRPVWCEDHPSECVQGPKQVLIWNQADNNNIEVDGFDLSGNHKSPAYNMKCGFTDGAQDIFVESDNTTSAVAPSSATSSSATSAPSGQGFLVSASTSGASSSPTPGPSSNPPSGSAASTLPTPASNGPASSLPLTPGPSSSPPDPNAPTSSLPLGAGPSSSSPDPNTPASSLPLSSSPPPHPTASDPPAGSDPSYSQPDTCNTPAARKRMAHHRRNGVF